MYEHLTLNSWVAVGEDCPISYRVHDKDDVVFVCDSGSRSFEFVFSAGSLRTFLGLGADALREMDSADSAVATPVPEAV
jgi:hypothetical protein